MFTINDDLSIYVTRGDKLFFTVKADDNGKPYVFQPGDIVRIKVYGKKNAENVVLQKDFPVVTATEGVEIYLSESDTKIGDVISKPTDYWYEVELNPYDNPQTIIGYDEDGAKIFRLLPEGRDMTELEPDIDPEDIPIVDKVLDMTSLRPVQNQAIARAVTKLEAGVKDNKEAADGLKGEIAVERARLDNLVAAAVAPANADSNHLEVADIRVGADGMTYGSAGTAVRGQVKGVLSEVSRTDKMAGIVQVAYESITGKYIDASGDISESENWAYTNPIEVTAGEKLIFAAQGYKANVSVISLCNADLSDITPVVISSSNDFEEYSYTVVEDGYVTLSYYTGNINKLYRITDRGNDAIYERIIGVENQTLVNAEKMRVLNNRSLWANKNLVAFGTSITWASADYAHDYLKIVKETCGFGAVVNLGRSGAGFANGTANGNGINYVVRNNEVNIANADLIILEGCTNDFKLNVEIGDVGNIGASFDTSRFTGALQDSIEYIYSVNPKARILCICDPHRNNGGYTSFTTNTAGYKLTDYISRMVAVCEMYSVPVVNWYAESGINMLNLSHYLKDGLHPNDNGYKLLGNITAKKVLELVPCDSATTATIGGVEYDISIADGYDYKLVIKTGSAMLLYYSNKPFAIWGSETSCYECFVPETYRASVLDGVFSANIVDFSAWEGLSKTSILNGDVYYYAKGVGARTYSEFVWANHNVLNVITKDILIHAAE